MTKKNVLLITVDQWSGHYMGCAGNQEILTPTLDEMARYGIRYTNAVSNTPVCIPARRELMLGVDSRTHGDRKFDESLPMPDDIPSMAGLFRQNGYQTVCCGKLHVFPQRDRIGFDDALLHEEGRHKVGMAQDDYERFLARSGHAGEEYGHSMCNNNYFGRPFHLPDTFHPTAWSTREMCEQILRKDPTRPAFWYLSYAAPHPPLTPPSAYLNMYCGRTMSAPAVGDWTEKPDLPFGYKYYSGLYPNQSRDMTDMARRAYYAGCTFIDNQIRLVMGTLREQGLLDDTVVLFTADHGEMLGTNRLFGKFLMYENSVCIPMILLPTADSGMECGRTDDRIVELKDVLPTLMTLAGLTVPKHIQGESVTEPARREYSYGELWEDDRATRMIRTKEYKLIWYITGNRFQLFHISEDPDELHDLISCPDQAERIRHMQALLMEHLYGSDLAGITNGRLTGLFDKAYSYENSLHDDNKLFQGRDLLLQRGIR